MPRDSDRYVYYHDFYFKSANAGYVMIQACSGVPVAVRMQAGLRIVADITVAPEAQDNQPPIVLLPDSREMNDPPPPYQAVASGYRTFQVDLPASYKEAEHGQWKTYV